MRRSSPNRRAANVLLAVTAEPPEAIEGTCITPSYKGQKKWDPWVPWLMWVVPIPCVGELTPPEWVLGKGVGA